MTDMLIAGAGAPVDAVEVDAVEVDVVAWMFAGCRGDWGPRPL